MHFQILAEVVHRVFKPYFTPLQEAVQFISSQAEQGGELVLREPMGAIRFDRHVLQCSTRGIVSGWDHLTCQIIGQFDGNLHERRIPPRRFPMPTKNPPHPGSVVLNECIGARSRPHRRGQCPGSTSATDMPITIMLVAHAITFHNREFLCSPIRSLRLMSISIRIMITGSSTPFSTCE